MGLSPLTLSPFLFSLLKLSGHKLPSDALVCHYPAVAMFDADVTRTAGGESAIKQRFAKATNTLSQLQFIHVAVSGCPFKKPVEAR